MAAIEERERRRHAANAAAHDQYMVRHRKSSAV
jgi:hypothetical protein